MTNSACSAKKLINLSNNLTKPKFTNKVIAFGLLGCLVFGLSLVQQSGEIRGVEAMSFNSSWNSAISSISATNTISKTQNLGFSYQNPFLDYPNLDKAYLNDPEYTKRTVEKIANYIEQNRSRDIFDARAGSPIEAAFCYETAIKYHVPLDQMLAVARSESRFGTDCYTGSGNPTRICTYKNIFSIGLTETSSLGFENWEAGVESFGRLYKLRKDRGYSDCEIWRIYNPNGEYCTKILSLASRINIFLTQE